MAVQIGAGKDFKFRNMQLFKTQPLGIGSYGSVYRAKCDQLPCAAKLLHPVLVNPKERRNLYRFEQECQFLSDIRHPHIVQYLGTCRDSESGLPVLLMELMDDSLTHFLDQSPEPLPYHLEVNLCHDIALALAYLHSNGIIHRDLSSNNVLLIAGSRAKVTDFGMSKLIDAAPQMTPLTQCPGTTAYMPPEAFKVPPVYTSKLDCFAHGVLGIQIMTRQFPEPGSALQDIEDPRSPTGSVSMPVLETERRKSHIDRIDPNHPLLPIAIRCLSYKERDRPSAQQLCHQLAVLKETPLYDQSMQRAQERERREESLTADLKAKDGRITELQRNVDGLQEQLCEKVVASQHEIQQLRQEIREKNDEISAGKTQLRDNEHIIAEFQQTLAKKDKRIKDLEETISTTEREVQEGPKPPPRRKLELEHDCSEASNTAADNIKLNWRKCPKAPCGMFRGSVVVDGHNAYFSTEWIDSNRVHAYDVDEEVWSQMPECPLNHSTLAMVKGLLTAVGGKQSLKPTSTLLSLTGEGSLRKWSKHFPPMPTKRYVTAVVCSGLSLIVAGGTGDNDTILSTVEVMNTENLQWFTASSLPRAFTEASATICGENLHLLGGEIVSGRVTNAVFTCSLSALFQSSRPQSLGASSQAEQPRVWRQTTSINSTCTTPLFESTCTTLCGQLLAVGGRDDLKRTTAIHMYDPVKNSWTVISHMPTPRYKSLVAVLPGDKLMVVGGYSHNSGFFREVGAILRGKLYGETVVEIGTVL